MIKSGGKGRALGVVRKPHARVMQEWEAQPHAELGLPPDLIGHLRVARGGDGNSLSLLHWG